MARTPVPPEWQVTLPRPGYAINDDGTPSGGRPSKLTDVVASKIIVALRLGAHQGPAAAWAGVRPETMSRWMHADGEPFESFQMKVKESEAWAELKAVGVVTKSSDAKDAIAFLERRFPKRWARVPSATAQTTLAIMDLGTMLDRIEARRKDVTAPHDPRPSRIIEHEALPPARPKREPVL